MRRWIWCIWIRRSIRSATTTCCSSRRRAAKAKGVLDREKAKKENLAMAAETPNLFMDEG